MKKILLILLCFIFSSDAKLFDFFGSKISKSDVEKNVNNLFNLSKTKKLDGYGIPEIFISGIPEKSLQKWRDFSKELQNYVAAEEARLFPNKSKEAGQLNEIINGFLINCEHLINSIKVTRGVKDYRPEELKNIQDKVNEIQSEYDIALKEILKPRLEDVKKMKINAQDKKAKQLFIDQETLLYLVYELGDKLRAKCQGIKVSIQSLRAIAKNKAVKKDF